MLRTFLELDDRAKIRAKQFLLYVNDRSGELDTLFMEELWSLEVKNPKIEWKLTQSGDDFVKIKGRFYLKTLGDLSLNYSSNMNGKVSTLVRRYEDIAHLWRVIGDKIDKDYEVDFERVSIYFDNESKFKHRYKNDLPIEALRIALSELEKSVRSFIVQKRKDMKRKGYDFLYTISDGEAQLIAEENCVMFEEDGSAIVIKGGESNE